jgi:uncharacterized membrane protein YesL
MLALRAMWRGIKDVWQKGYTYIWANLAFIVACIPIITIPAAWSALYKVCHEAQTSPSNADIDLFWEAFKANFLRSLPWGACHTAFAVVNFLNLTTYNTSQDPFTIALRVVWWGATFLWLGVLLVSWTFFYEMESPTLMGATRNAVIFVLQNPLFTLIILGVIGVICLLSTLLVALWLVLTVSTIGAIGTSAVMMQLEIYRKQLDEG